MRSSASIRYGKRRYAAQGHERVGGLAGRVTSPNARCAKVRAPNRTRARASVELEHALHQPRRVDRRVVGGVAGRLARAQAVVANTPRPELARARAAPARRPVRARTRHSSAATSYAGARTAARSTSPVPRGLLRRCHERRQARRTRAGLVHPGAEREGRAAPGSRPSISVVEVGETALASCASQEGRSRSGSSAARADGSFPPRRRALSPPGRTTRPTAHAQRSANAANTAGIARVRSRSESPDARQRYCSVSSSSPARP